MNLKIILSDHRAKTKESKFISIVMAFLFVVLAFSQIFTLEGFISVVKGYGIFGANWTATLLSIVIIVMEVLAIPFLLDVKLHEYLVICSMLAGWMVSIFWLFIAIYLNITRDSFQIGLLGTKIPLVSGWWLVALLSSVILLIVWSNWGLWPIKKNNKRVNK